MNRLMAAVKQEIEQSFPSATFHFHVFKIQIRESLIQERLMATLTGFFGLLAAVLASLGLYGVMSYAVARRTNEIGIRMALGARQSRVLSMILGEAVMLLVIGLVIGTGLALAANRVTRTMLFGLEPHDPLTLALAAGLLATVAVAASYFPARRAARLDPMLALRLE
ncbi:MAG: FtsX-like permease family protein [Candidatus Acidiferrales bacterium]